MAADAPASQPDATADGDALAVAGALVRDPARSDPAQLERARQIAEAFQRLHARFEADLPVRQLFSIDDSETFCVEDAEAQLNRGGVDRNLVLQFMRAGFPIPDEAAVTPAPEGSSWQIEAVTGPPLRQIAATWEGRKVRLDREALPSGADLTYWQVARDGRTDPVATFVRYNAAAGEAIIDRDLAEAPESITLIPRTRYVVKLRERDHRLDVYGSSYDPSFLIQYRIAEIDDILSQQLSAIMHHPELQRLESTWRGLHDLVFNSETSSRLKLRVLNVTKDDLRSDLENAVEFDQSALFKKVYEEEYGTFGGSPFSALLGDFSFGRHPKDVILLEKLSNVAAAAHAPMITAAAADLFDLTDFRDLDKPRDLTRIFESAELIKWRSFRDSEDSRYITLVLPRVLMRTPYGPDSAPVAEFDFTEEVNVTDPGRPDGLLWGNPAWALGRRITEAFARYSWTGAIRGYEGGGMVPGLPLYTYRTDHGDVAVKVPTEVIVTDRREKELSDLGFIALCYRKGSDSATFFGGQTANRPREYLTADATANARLSSSLPYLLAASRFAHYIKVMMRDRIGSFMTEANVSAMLNRWIAQYVLLNDEAGQGTKARYPLREARVDVSSDPERPGCYRAVVFLRPHFQLEELTVSLRLVAELPASASAAA